MESTTARVAQLDVVVAGDPMEMGIEQGVKLHDRIQTGRGILAKLEAFQMMKPPWMPTSIFRRICEYKASSALASPLKKEFPDADLRLRGIAEGSGVSLDAIYLFTAMESMLSDKRNCIVVPALGACSALAVRGRFSAIGEPVIVRNFDYLHAVQPLYSMRKTLPQKGLRSLDFTMAPFAGAVDGVNENGLCITYNYAYTTDVAASSAPISIVIAETLQHCSTVQEAAAWIRSRPRWGAGILMLADASGELASMELSTTRAELRVAQPDEDALFHTNSFWTEPMRQIQVEDQAIYTEKAPQALRGRLLHESAVKRADRFKQLLKQKEPMELDALGKIMADHGESNQRSDTTICVHGPYWSTTASLQLFPKSRRIRVAFDSACQARHTEIAL